MAGIFLSVYTLLVVLAIFFLVPPAEGLGNLVRIAFFHIPVAWISVLAFCMSAWWAAAYLRHQSMRADELSARSARLGFGFVLLAVISGAWFAKLTWGAWWNWDPRQTTIFVLVLIYGAYLSLRASMTEPKRRARLAAVYSLLSCLTVPFLVFVIPRFYFSLHPSPILNAGGHIDMDPVMLAVLLAALLDMTGIYFWLLFHRQQKEEKLCKRNAM